MRRVVWICLALVAVSLPAQAAGGGPAGRIYAGGIGGRVGNDSGGGGVMGFESHSERTVAATTFWGLEGVGIKVGDTGTLPVLGGNFGLRYVFAADSSVRPFVKGNVGLSFLVVVPVPSLALSAGIDIPLGDVLHLDVTLSGREYLNIFDSTKSITAGTFEVGVGF